MTPRLTLADAVVGARVVCVSDERGTELVRGRHYTVERTVCGEVLLREIRSRVFFPYRFTLAPPAAPDSAIGWLFHNPDTGTEFSDSHPVESGECDDAENICPATAANLLSELREAWQAISEFREQRETPAAQPSVRAMLAEHAPGLLGALVEWWANPASHVTEGALFDAINEAALIPAAPAPVALPAMWLGADAFEGEG